jgi:hypothetical protein
VRKLHIILLIFVLLFFIILVLGVFQKPSESNKVADIQNANYTTTYADLWQYSDGLGYNYTSKNSSAEFKVKLTKLMNEDVWKIKQNTTPIGKPNESVAFSIYRSVKNQSCIKVAFSIGETDCSGVDMIYPKPDQKPVFVSEAQMIHTLVGNYSAKRYDFDVVVDSGTGIYSINRLVFWKSNEVPVPLRIGLISNYNENAGTPGQKVEDWRINYVELMNWSVNNN